jgi:hypothetical protein
MIKKLYLGIDPDLRLINAAVVSDQKQVLALFKRKNTGKKADAAVANAALVAESLVKDVLKYINHIYTTSPAGTFDPSCYIHTIVESQSMMHAKRMREDGKNINYESIKQVAQMAGIMLGAFSSISTKLTLVQPSEWKGNLDKRTAHNRYYGHLNLTPDPARRVACIYPTNMAELILHSEDRINMGDFLDINDSIGLALHGIKKKL